MYDRTARFYDTRYASIQMAKYRALIGFLPKRCETALDLGCGSGLFAGMLKKRTKMLVGLDISLEMIRISAKRKKCAMIRGDAENLPFRDESFDLVTCITVLQNLPNPKGAVLEIARVLKVRGLAILTSLRKKHSFVQLKRWAAQAGLKTVGAGEIPNSEDDFCVAIKPMYLLEQIKSYESDMKASDVRKKLPSAKRAVIKVGTTSITNEMGRLNPEKVGRLVREIMKLRSMGKEAILVSSGAIGAGVGKLNLKKRPKELPKLQAAAAVGQGILMQVYSKYFGEYDQPVAQMLLTGEDFIDKRRFQNFRNTMETLLSWGVIPIINENDSVEVDEIRLGDNDTLSAYVTVGSGADLLVILSDVDGLYSNFEGKKRELIKVVDKITGKIEAMVSKNCGGFGGMKTKIGAAKIATRAGIPTIIANSGEKNVLERIINGEDVGTLFLPRRRG